MLSMMNFCPRINDQINVIIHMIILILVITNNKYCSNKEVHTPIILIIKSVRANTRVLNPSKTLLPLYEEDTMNDLLIKNKTMVIPQKVTQESNHSIVLIKLISNH